MTNRPETEVALEAGKQLALASQKAQTLVEGGIPFILSDEGQPTSVEEFLPRPLRVRQRLVFPDLASFTAYVTDNLGSIDPGEATRIFADFDACTVTAYLDYHGSKPGHLAHTAMLTLKKSEEWNAWGNHHGKGLGQDQLAEFLEERVLDIRDPDSGAVLDAVRNLKLSRNGKYDRTVDLTNGNVQFHFIDEVLNRGNYTLPSLLKLQLRVFEHGEHYEVPVQLRYRLREDKLVFVLKLHRPDLILKDAFGQILAAVETGTTIKPLIGSVK